MSPTICDQIFRESNDVHSISLLMKKFWRLQAVLFKQKKQIPFWFWFMNVVKNKFVRTFRSRSSNPEVLVQSSVCSDDFGKTACYQHAISKSNLIKNKINTTPALLSGEPSFPSASSPSDFLKSSDVCVFSANMRQLKLSVFADFRIVVEKSRHTEPQY